jgi:hypothetical protein
LVKAFRRESAGLARHCSIDGHATDSDQAALTDEAVDRVAYPLPCGDRNG